MTDVSRCVPPRAATMIRVWVRRKSPAPANPWSQGRRSREPGAAGPPGAAESAGAEKVAGAAGPPGAEEVAGAAGGRGCCAMRQWHHEPPRSSMVLPPGPDVEPVGLGWSRHRPERLDRPGPVPRPAVSDTGDRAMESDRRARSPAASDTGDRRRRRERMSTLRFSTGSSLYCRSGHLDDFRRPRSAAPYADPGSRTRRIDWQIPRRRPRVLRRHHQSGDHRLPSEPDGGAPGLERRRGTGLGTRGSV